MLRQCLVYLWVALIGLGVLFLTLACSSSSPTPTPTASPIPRPTLVTVPTLIATPTPRTLTSVPSLGVTCAQVYQPLLASSIRWLPQGRLNKYTEDWHSTSTLGGAIMVDLFGPCTGLEAVEIWFSPNPPKDTDGRREESGRRVRELQGE